MIEKWASSRKVSLDEAKQALLAHAGIALRRATRYRRTHRLSGFSCRPVDDGHPTADRWWRSKFCLVAHARHKISHRTKHRCCHLA
jgi:hypothetical protein